MAWCRSLQWESREETRQLLAQPDGAVALWLGRPVGPSGGYTPLYVCAREGNLGLLLLLLLRVAPGAHGAVVNAASNTGYTPLHWASGNGHLAVAQCLLAHGAVVNVVSDTGHIPLHWASAENHQAVVSLLTHPPEPDFTPPSLQHLASFSIWRACGPAH